MGEEFKQLYQYLKDTKVTDLDESEFMTNMNDPENRKQLHSYLQGNKLTDLSVDEFDSSIGFGGERQNPNEQYTKLYQTEGGKVPKYQGTPLSPQAARMQETFGFPDAPNPLLISSNKELHGKTKKEVENELQNQYRVLENDKIAKSGKLPQSSINAIEKQISDRVEHLSKIDKPEYYDVVSASKEIENKISKGAISSGAYEKTRNEAENNFRTLQDSYNRVNEKTIESLGFKKGVDVLSAYLQLKELEKDGKIAPAGIDAIKKIEKDPNFQKLQKFGELVVAQKDEYDKDFVIENIIEDTRKAFQIKADKEQKKGKSDNSAKLIEGMGESMVHQLETMWKSLQGVSIKLTGKMIPIGADAYIYNNLALTGRKDIADNYILERYKEEKVERKSEDDSHILPSDITKPLFEKNVAIDGVNLIIGKDGKVEGARDAKGFLVSKFTEKEVSAAKKYEANPNNFEVISSTDKGQRAKSLAYTAARVMVDMAPVLAGAALSGGTNMGVMIPMFAQLYGDYYNTSFEQTGDAVKSAAYATAAAAAQSYLETKVGNIEKRFGNALDRSKVQQTADNIGKQVLDGKIVSRDLGSVIVNKGEQLFKDLGTENAEEYLQQRSDEFAATAFGIQQDPNTFLDDVETAAVTTLATTGFSTITSIASKNTFKESIRRAIDNPVALEKAIGFLAESGNYDKKDAEKKVQFINNIAGQAKEYSDLGYEGKDLEKIKDLLVDKGIEEARQSEAKTDAGRKRSQNRINELNDALDKFDDAAQTAEEEPITEMGSETGKGANPTGEQEAPVSEKPEDIIEQKESTSEDEDKFNNGTRGDYVGSTVQYGNSSGSLVEDDGVYYIQHKNGDLTPIESGSSDNTNINIGLKLVKNVAQKPIEDANYKDVLFDPESNTVNAYGNTYTYESANSDKSGNTVSITVVDNNGNKKTIRNKDLVSEIEYQKTLYEIQKDGRQVTESEIITAAEQVGAKESIKEPKVTEQVQPTGQVENNEQNKAKQETEPLTKSKEYVTVKAGGKDVSYTKNKKGKWVSENGNVAKGKVLERIESKISVQSNVPKIQENSPTVTSEVKLEETPANIPAQELTPESKNLQKVPKLGTERKKNLKTPASPIEQKNKPKGNVIQQAKKAETTGSLRWMVMQWMLDQKYGSGVVKDMVGKGFNKGKSKTIDTGLTKKVRREKSEKEFRAPFIDDKTVSKAVPRTIQDLTDWVITNLNKEHNTEVDQTQVRTLVEEIVTNYNNPTELAEDLITEIENATEEKISDSEGERLIREYRQEKDPLGELSDEEMLAAIKEDEEFKISDEGLAAVEEEIKSRRSATKGKISDIKFSAEEETSTSNAPKTNRSAQIKSANSFNLDKLITRAIVEKDKVKAKALRSIQSLLPTIRSAGMKIFIHPDSNSMLAAQEGVGFTVNYAGKGFFNPENNEIHINLEKVTEDTPIHEVIHPIIASLAKSNPRAFRRFVGQVKNDPVLGKFLTDYVTRNYPDAKVNDELVVKFLGVKVAEILEAKGKLSIENKTVLEKIVQFFKNLLKDLGITPSVDILGTVNDRTSVIKFAESLADIIGNSGKIMFNNSIPKSKKIGGAKLSIEDTAGFETRDGYPIGFNYDTDKVARVRGYFSKVVDRLSEDLKSGVETKGNLVESVREDLSDKGIELNKEDEFYLKSLIDKELGIKTKLLEDTDNRWFKIQNATIATIMEELGLDTPDNPYQRASDEEHIRQVVEQGLNTDVAVNEILLLIEKGKAIDHFQSTALQLAFVENAKRLSAKSEEIAQLEASGKKPKTLERLHQEMDILEANEIRIASALELVGSMAGRILYGRSKYMNYPHMTDPVLMHKRNMRQFEGSGINPKLEEKLREMADQIINYQKQIQKLNKGVKDTTKEDRAESAKKALEEQKAARNPKTKKDAIQFLINSKVGGKFSVDDTGNIEPTPEEKRAFRLTAIRTLGGVALKDITDVKVENLVDPINKLIEEANKSLPDDNKIELTKLDEIVDAYAFTGTKNVDAAIKELEQKKQAIRTEAKRIKNFETLLDGVVNQGKPKPPQNDFTRIINILKKNAKNGKLDQADAKTLEDALDKIQANINESYKETNGKIKKEKLDQALSALKEYQRARQKPKLAPIKVAKVPKTPQEIKDARVNKQIESKDRLESEINDIITKLNDAKSYSNLDDATKALIESYQPKKRANDLSNEIIAKFKRIAKAKKKISGLAETAKKRSEENRFIPTLGRITNDDNSTSIGFVKISPQELGRNLYDVLFKFPRALLLTADVSGVGTNGLLGGLNLLTKDPKALKKAYVDALKAGWEGFKGSEKAAIEHYEEIQENGGDVYEHIFGLKLSHPFDPELSEEYFQSSHIYKIAGLKNIVQFSEAHMVTYLNAIRFNLFDSFYQLNPTASQEELKNFAQIVNRLTGTQGQLTGKILNDIFIAFKYMVSRLKYMAIDIPMGLAGTIELMKRSAGSPNYDAVAAERAAQTFRVFGSVALLMGIASLAGVDWDFDPWSTSFLKGRVGDEYYELLSGIGPIIRSAMGQILVFDYLNGSEGMEQYKKNYASKLVSGKSLSGSLTPTIRYFTGRLNNIVGIGFASLTGSNAIGMPYKGDFSERLGQIAMDNLIPMTIGYIIKKAQKEDKNAKDLLDILISAHGFNILDYNNQLRHSKVQDFIKENNLNMSSSRFNPTEDAFVNGDNFIKNDYRNRVENKLGENMLPYIEQESEPAGGWEYNIKQWIVNAKSETLKEMESEYIEKYGAEYVQELKDKVKK